MGCITLKYTKWILGVFYVVFAYGDAGFLKVKSTKVSSD
jgi:hypothetical protein